MSGVGGSAQHRGGRRAALAVPRILVMPPTAVTFHRCWAHTAGVRTPRSCATTAVVTAVWRVTDRHEFNMPTYEYRCPRGHEFDLFQRMSDEPQAACPECGESATRLMSGGAGLIFKGDGFYITDYRSDAYKKAASSDKEAASSEKKAASGDAGAKSTTGPGSDGASSSDGGSSKSRKGSPRSSDASGGSKPSQAAKSSSSDS